MSRILERVNILICVVVALLILLSVGRAEGAGDNEPNLLKLAENKFGTLTEAEEKLFRKVVNGVFADCNDRTGKNNDPNGAKDWGPKTGTQTPVLSRLTASPGSVLTHKHRRW